MENLNEIKINELSFSHFLEMGKIAIEQGGVPAEIIEKTLKRIALENELTFHFVC